MENHCHEVSVRIIIIILIVKFFEEKNRTQN